MPSVAWWQSRTFCCSKPEGSKYPTHKIDSIIRRQRGVPDADAPDNPESTRFWASTGDTTTETVMIGEA